MNNEKTKRLWIDSPSAEYRAKIFWAWNGKLDKNELLHQIDIIKKMGLGGFFMHSRVGLETEYLGAEWFELIRECACYAYEQGLEAWLYDEDRWPSGISGGIVTKHEEYRMRFISRYHSDEEMIHNSLIKKELMRFAVKTNSCGELLDYFPVKAEDKLPNGYKLDIYVEELMLQDDSYNGDTYLDTLNPQAVNYFIETTHEAYKKNVGDLFGKEIKGIFMDEPHRGTLFNDLGTYNKNHSNMAPYTESLFSEYSKMWGEDLHLMIPEIFYRAVNGAWNKTTHNYLQTVETLYLNAFAIPYYEWCRQNNLLVTGHIFHEDSLYMQTLMNSSVMRFYEYMDYPGIDTLGREHRYFTTVKQCASVARQLGKKFVLSELFGCTGWQTTFDDYKKMGDWQTFYGATLRCPHLGWYTMEGIAKRDYPASILHQSYWHTEFSYLEDYFSRLSYLLTEGESQAKVLVINPIEQMWGLAHASWIKDWFVSSDEKVAAMDAMYENQLKELSAKHIDFDYGDEDILCKYGSVEEINGKVYLKVGQVYYEEILDEFSGFKRETTHRLLKEFKDLGGKVVSSIKELSVNESVCVNESVYVTVRKLGAELWVLLKGLSETPIKKERIVLPSQMQSYRFVELWDFRAGECLGKIDIKTYNFDFTNENEYVLCLTNDDSAENYYLECCEPIKLPHEMKYELTEPNILVMDRAVYYVDGILRNDGKARDVLKIDEAVRDFCGLPLRGGGMLQPWYVTKYGLFDVEKVLADVCLEFSFNVKEIPNAMVLALEQSERYEIYLNGKRVPGNSNSEHWIDICFDKVDVSKFICHGENILQLKTHFTQETNIENVYLLGDFAVNNNREIISLPKTITIGVDIKDQGFPYYSGSIKYYTGINDGVACLKFDDINCALIKVYGGEKEQYIAFSPYELSPFELSGELILECFFTRRNTFAALHLKEIFRDRYNPGLFLIDDGDEYSEDYVLIKQGI